jgi:ribosomal protein L11 methyltransferase
MRRRAGSAGFVVYRIAAPEAEAERLIAELSSLGTLGVEERDGELGAYFPAGAAVDAALRALADPSRHIGVSGPESVPDADWEAEWRRGLAPRCIAGLWVRPSFCASAGQPELVIDPQQAFGSGEHATTRLALELLLGELRPGDSLLDVGTGSGILALAALRRGAARAVGFDTDPVAIENAAENRARNALPLALYCGGIEALAHGVRFDVCVANLLVHELLPGLEALVARTGRALVLSGALEREWEKLAAHPALARFRVARALSEAQSGDVWGARLLLHGAARQTSSSSPSESSKA